MIDAEAIERTGEAGRVGPPWVRHRREDAIRDRAWRGALIQLCFVVEDLEAAMAEFSAIFGAGPWFVSEGQPAHLDRTVYRGEAVPLGTRIVLGYAGDMMYELACPKAGSRSIFQERVNTHGHGLHHFGFAVSNFEAAEVAARKEGAEVLTTSVTARGARILMTGGGRPLGVLEEYIEMLPASHRFYAFMRSAAAGWDGRELVFDGEMPDFDAQQ